VPISHPVVLGKKFTLQPHHFCTFPFQRSSAPLLIHSCLEWLTGKFRKERKNLRIAFTRLWNRLIILNSVIYTLMNAAYSGLSCAFLNSYLLEANPNLSAVSTTL
jgi:hypothetical protein